MPQVLAVASRETKDALRMVHVPSFKTFANWPTAGTPLKCAPPSLIGFDNPNLLPILSVHEWLFCERLPATLIGCF